MRYFIKDTYTHRDKPNHFDDTQNTNEWQHEVYHLAYTIAKIIPEACVIDIGCGSGYKLVNIFKDFMTIGIEVKETYNFLIQKYSEDKYSNHKWEIFNEIVPKQKCGIVILSDVIEHISDPDAMLSYIKNIDFQYLIISTPYRDSISLSQDGPPINTSHAREWTIQEFKYYIEQHFEIVNHFIINKSQHTQCIICKKI